MDAGLGIDDIQDKLEFLAKGNRTPFYTDEKEGAGYFNLFNNSLADGKHSHQWFSKRVVTMFDDHDQVGTKHKFRFCGSPGAYQTLPLALALNLTTSGIPCIYYGTEQSFNGADQRFNEDNPKHSDTVLRECVFGGGFGSLQSMSRHFFNEGHEIYLWIGRLAGLRKQHPALRRGRQYIREVSATGNADEFYYPAVINNELRWVVAWSRVFNSVELLCAMNTNKEHELTVWVTVDVDLSPHGSKMHCLFSSDDSMVGSLAPVTSIIGRCVVKLTLRPAGFVVYSN